MRRRTDFLCFNETSWALRCVALRAWASRLGDLRSGALRLGHSRSGALHSWGLQSGAPGTVLIDSFRNTLEASGSVGQMVCAEYSAVTVTLVQLGGMFKETRWAIFGHGEASSLHAFGASCMGGWVKLQRNLPSLSYGTRYTRFGHRFEV